MCVSYLYMHAQKDAQKEGQQNVIGGQYAMRSEVDSNLLPYTFVYSLTFSNEPVSSV